MTIGYPEQVVIPLTQATARDPAIGDTAFLPKIDVGDWSHVQCYIRTLDATPPADSSIVLSFRWYFTDSNTVGANAVVTDTLVVPVPINPSGGPPTGINLPVRGKFLEILAYSLASPSEHRCDWAVTLSNKVVPVAVTPVTEPILASVSYVATAAGSDAANMTAVTYGRLFLSWRLFLASGDTARVRVEVAERLGAFPILFQEQLTGPLSGEGRTVELPSFGTWCRLSVTKTGSAGLGDLTAALAPFPSYHHGG